MTGLINENEFKAQIKFQSDLLNACEQKIDVSREFETFLLIGSVFCIIFRLFFT